MQVIDISTATRKDYFGMFLVLIDYSQNNKYNYFFACSKMRGNNKF